MYKDVNGLKESSREVGITEFEIRSVESRNVVYDVGSGV